MGESALLQALCVPLAAGAVSWIIGKRGRHVCFALALFAAAWTLGVTWTIFRHTGVSLNIPWFQAGDLTLGLVMKTTPLTGLLGLAVAGFTLLLSMLHLRVPGWPFHPAGYLVVGSWGALRYWLPIFVTWLIKTGILRYGGLVAHNKALPFFVGLILGEFSAGFLRTIVDLAYRLYLPAMSGIGGL